MTLSAASAADAPSDRSGSAARDEVAAIIVTYNSARTVAALVDDLHKQGDDVHLDVVVVDNASQDATCDVARAAGARVIETGQNLGFAGGANRGLLGTGDSRAVLILNADLRVPPGAVRAMLDRLDTMCAGMVVPKLLDGEGRTYPSLRFEPTLWRAAGDALLGSRAPRRPPWLTEMDFDDESYDYPHPVDWATGAAMLVDSRAIDRVGLLDERFFLYSEETDYMRRTRQAGLKVWYEPAAVLTHEGQGSGTSPDLSALMAVNRVRYAELNHGPAYARSMRLIVTLAALLRMGTGADARRALRYLLHRGSWPKLPSASGPSGRGTAAHLPRGNRAT